MIQCNELNNVPSYENDKFEENKNGDTEGGEAYSIRKSKTNRRK